MPAEGAVERAPDIYLNNFCLSYNDRPLFHNLNWSLPSKQWTCLLGQSGIGKSSLLRFLAGLSAENSKTAGTLTLTKQIAYLGQNDALLPWLSAFDNAVLSARLRSYSPREENIIKER
ncbi:MAG TPA: ATP-binding cassette domain-containing protein, partial [Gammaproteobacteria bacterium]|nr:ATP-binding cassette domain-containing protein [Gammaproteobacteria bacterium]